MNVTCKERKIPNKKVTYWLQRSNTISGQIHFNAINNFYVYCYRLKIGEEAQKMLVLGSQTSLLYKVSSILELWWCIPASRKYFRRVHVRNLSRKKFPLVEDNQAGFVHCYQCTSIVNFQNTCWCYWGFEPRYKSWEDFMVLFWDRPLQEKVLFKI